MASKEECIAQAIAALEKAEYMIESSYDRAVERAEIWTDVARTWAKLAQVLDNE